MIHTLQEAKQLRERWDVCTNDTERIKLAHETKQIRFTLDNDNTTCTIKVDWGKVLADEKEEMEDVYYLGSLNDDFGNRSGVETLLNYLQIPFEYC